MNFTFFVAVTSQTIVDSFTPDSSTGTLEWVRAGNITSNSLLPSLLCPFMWFKEQVACLSRKPWLIFVIPSNSFVAFHSNLSSSSLHDFHSLFIWKSFSSQWSHHLLALHVEIFFSLFFLAFLELLWATNYPFLLWHTIANKNSFNYFCLSLF